MELTAVQLRENIWQLGNAEGNCATLVVGSCGALLFDTMLGLGDLRGLVEGITTLPLTVVNSHGHYDHVGGNRQFDSVYISPLDKPVVARTEAYLSEIGSNMGRDLSSTADSYHMFDRLLDLEPGMVFDLGGVTAEAVALPGHTAGSMGLHLRESRIMLVGDAISPQMCLFFPDSLGLEEYRETLRRLMGMDFDTFIQGHYQKEFPKSLLGKLWDCAQLPGNARGHKYINTHIPEYTGRMYILEFRNQEAGGIVCIIVRE